SPKKTSSLHPRHHRSHSSKRTPRTGSVHEDVSSAPATIDDAESTSPTLPLAEPSQASKNDAPRAGVKASGRGSKGPSPTAAENSESTAQRQRDCDCPSEVDAVTAQRPESSMSEQTAFVTPAPVHRPSCADGLLQGADSDAHLARTDERTVIPSVSSSSTSPMQPIRLLSPQFANSEESAPQNPEKAGVPSGVGPSSGIRGSESRRVPSLSPTAAAAIAAAASYAPFVGVNYDAVAVPRTDGGEAAMGPEAAAAADAYAVGADSQLPDTGGGAGRPYRPRSLSDGAALKRLFDLLAQLDCFWLAHDLFSGDTQRVQSSIRVLATMVLLLLVLWLAAVPNSAEKSWRASSVGLLLIASLTMDLVAAPMASLLPFLCMPLLELADARAAALPYSTVRQMSFLCAMLLVLTMEECGLSTRLALLILSHTGHKINSILALVIAVAVTMTCLLDAFCVTVLMMSTVECIVDEIYFHVVQANVPAGMSDPGQRPCHGSGASPGSVPQPQSMESTEHLSYFAYRRYIFSECTTYIR
ncbi:uncharacterized protein LOC119435579, partial [Dermacentor silvarum]|uniref:uncharacterized protein LOC119435579 n=1 Tax=Dermacentor silvarum TaxID=543639 RepID=UPI002101A2D0